MRSIVEHLEAAYSTGAGILADRNRTFAIFLDLAFDVVPVGVIIKNALPWHEQGHPNALQVALEAADKVAYEPSLHHQATFV